MTATISVNGITFGPGHIPAFWPDIDLYFKRDIEVALDLVSRLADAGSAFLKAAVLHDPDICLQGGHPVTFFDRVSGEMVNEPYADVIRRHVLPLSQLKRITTRAAERGLILALSVYDISGLEFAVGEGAAVIKIPSSNIVHQHLIEAAAETGIPIVIDTGRSRWAEIARAVYWVEAAGARERLMLQHSPPGPPAGPEHFRMRMIEELGRCFGCPVGLSDHHPGTDMFPIACAVGAAMIEKGIMADGTVGDIDIAHALPVSAVGRALDLIRQSWLSLGAGRRPDTEVGHDPARMGLIAAKDIKAGQSLDIRNVRFAFPRLEIGVEHWKELVGCRTRRDVPEGSPIAIDDLELLKTDAGKGDAER